MFMHSLVIYRLFTGDANGVGLRKPGEISHAEFGIRCTAALLTQPRIMAELYVKLFRIKSSANTSTK